MKDIIAESFFISLTREKKIVRKLNETKKKTLFFFFLYSMLRFTVFFMFNAEDDENTLAVSKENFNLLAQSMNIIFY